MTMLQWKTFDTQGYAARSLDDLFSSSPMLIFEGGIFQWPGVKVGHRTKVSNSFPWSKDK